MKTAKAPASASLSVIYIDGKSLCESDLTAMSCIGYGVARLKTVEWTCLPLQAPRYNMSDLQNIFSGPYLRPSLDL